MAPIVAYVRRRLVTVVLLSLVGGLLEALVLVLVVNVATALAAGQARSPVDLGPLRMGSGGIGTDLVIALCLVILRVACQLGASWSAARLAGAVQHRLRRESISAFAAASWELQSAEREGRLQQLASIEVDRAATAALTSATLLTAGCNLVMLTVAALLLSPVAAGATISAVAILHVALRPITRRGRRHVTTRGLGEFDVAQTINEVVRTAEETRVFGVGSRQVELIDHQAANVARYTTRTHFLGLSVSNLYQTTAIGLVIAGLAALNLAQPESLGALGSMVLVLLRSFAYSQQAQASFHTLNELAPSVRQVADQRDRYLAATARSGRERLASVTSLQLDNVGYEYRPGCKALDGLSFEVEPGTTVGVIGPSGAGKSTLVQVLLRLRYPTTGCFLVNGRAATDYLAEDWASLVSYVPQEPKLIAGTAAENIRFYRDQLTDDVVERAGREAHIHDEILSWPLGYETEVGQRADAVSGGQRQRLCLARALATRPALLVLDEPTSALDIRSESLVQQTLRELKGRTTMFVIAHRVSTLSICDRLLVLDHGRVEAFGTPAELTAMGGFYQEALQLSGLA